MRGLADLLGLDDRYHPLSSVVERWSSAILRLTAVCYLLRTFPLLMWAVSIPGTFLVFLIGLGAGAFLVACCAVVLVWCAFEKPGDTPGDATSMARLQRLAELKADREAARGQEEPPGQLAPGSVAALPSHPKGLPSSLSQHSLHGILFSSLQAGMPIPTRPPVAKGGKFEGILWVGTSDTYAVGSGLIAKWPPPDAGLDPIATRWHGTVAGGTLVLQMYLVPEAAPGGSSPRASGASGSGADASGAGRPGAAEASCPLSSHFLTIPLSGLQ
eukprot:jgi/Tetstr1/428978/TSEL_018953.t1